MSQPTVVATVSGPSGFETPYISFASIVDSDGPLDAVPTVTSVNTDLCTVSDAAITFAGTINGTTYSAGEILTFKVTRVGTAKGLASIDIDYETEKRKERARVQVRLQDYEV